ncbi:MAG: glycosyltransferase [Armatimonadetes bacterium]|nr:glycosyltransferase [Armatimonadota bacterium]
MNGQPLRVAVFTDSALPILNGVSVSIDVMVRELRNQGHSVHLFCPKFPGHRESDPNTHRFPAVETPWTRGFPFAYPPYLGMLREFRKNTFDVVHLHTLGIVGFIGLRWAESHELPVVATYHTLYDRYAHYVPYVPRRYMRFKIAKHTNYFFNRADRVITPSEASYRWLMRHDVKTPTTIIPTGVDRTFFGDRAQLRQSFGVLPHQKILLYVGRLAREKNIEVLLDAAQLIFERDPDARLWLAGDGYHREPLTRHAQALKIGDRVKFLGFVPHEKIEELYAAADVFTFPSVTETQGLVVQEAMLHGLPTVAIGGGGASLAVTDGVTGYVVRNDPEDFAEHVLGLLHDEATYEQMSLAAAREGRKFGVGSMVQAVVQVYREAIDLRGGVRARHESYLG